MAPGQASEAAWRRRIARLLVVRCSGHGADSQRRYPRWELGNADLKRLLTQGVGGVILLGGSAAELRLRTQQLQSWSDTPLLLCADVEEGVGQRFEGASWLAPPLSLSRLYGEDPTAALALAERYGRCTGLEARALGLNWVLAPVCDVNNNPANPVINVRAWGEDPATAGALATAFLRGAQAEGVLCCAKHFPGHGDTSSDSHLELPLLEHSRERLEQVELPPFRQAIAAGVASVMTAHLLLPALDPERPATLSAAVLSSLLRRDLGFQGLVVTDALVMEAIAGRYGAGEAAVLALEAGADLVLMPADADAAIEAILGALQSGRLSPERLEASLERRRLALALAALPPGATAEWLSTTAESPSATAGPPGTTALLASTTALLASTTALPTSTTAGPNGTAEPPSTTAVLGSTTAGPAGATALPAITTDSSTNTAAKPHSTPVGPANATAEPPSATAVLASTTAGSTNTTAVPTSATAMPAGTTTRLPSSAARPAGAHPLGVLHNGPRPSDQHLALELLERSLERQGPAANASWWQRPESKPDEEGDPSHAASGLNLIRVDNALASPFLPANAPALELPAAAGWRSCLIEARIPSPWQDDPQAPLALDRLGAGAVLLQLFVRGNPFRGSAGGGQEPWEAVIDQLQNAGRLRGLAVYGSPYLWRRLRARLDPSVPAAYSPAQMPRAQEQVLAALGLKPTARASSTAITGHEQQAASEHATGSMPNPQGFTD